MQKALIDLLDGVADEYHDPEPDADLSVSDLDELLREDMRRDEHGERDWRAGADSRRNCGNE